MQRNKTVNTISLMMAACVAGGFFLTRLAGSVPTFLAFIFNLGSIVLLLSPIAYDLYIQKYGSKSGIKVPGYVPMFSHDLLYKLLAAGSGFFLMLFGIRWLQGKPFVLFETVNTAIILSFVFYLYQVYIKPHMPFGHKKN